MLEMLVMQWWKQMYIIAMIGNAMMKAMLVIQ